MNALPLEGIRIIDLTHAWAGPHATRLLADFGAEVIRVEYTGRLCLLRGGKKEGKAYNKLPGWHHINRNKKSVTLDLNHSEDREALMELIKVADVFTENGRTGVAQKWGLSFEELRRIKQDIIMVSMAGFGSTGPYASLAGYGATFEAISGIQNLTAYAEGSKPFRIKEMDIINGISAACAIMTALIHRQKTGQGQHIDFSHMEASSHALIGEHLLSYAMNGMPPSPSGNRSRRFAPQGCYRCKGEDRWITLTVRTEEEWRSLCNVLGHTEYHADARYDSVALRFAHHDEIDSMIEDWTLKHSHLEGMRILQANGIPACAVLDSADIRRDPHLKARNYFPAGDGSPETSYLGVPFVLTRGSGRIRWRGPDLGEHNKDVLCGLIGLPKEKIRPINEEEIGTAFDPS